MADTEAAKTETTAAAEPPAAPADDTKKDAPAETVEGECTAQFEAVVQLEEVEEENGEEEEEVTFKMRAKLFVYGETLLDKGTGKKQWNERGIGDIRLLKHKESGRIRILMRQEKLMKIIVNHLVNPDTPLTVNAGSDRSWVWTACDFSSGEIEDTVFAVRFGNSDKAKEYKEAYEGAQEEMKKVIAGADAEDTAAGDEAAEALESLSTKE